MRVRLPSAEGAESAHASPHGPAEIVQHEMSAADLELCEQRAEMAGVAAHGIVEPLRFVGVAKAGHVGRYAAAEGAGAAHQIVPVAREAGIAVQEDQGFVAVLGPRLRHDCADPGHAQFASSDHCGPLGKLSAPISAAKIA
jgi:hypothetical protein